ncbi:hypothetical protein BTVI_80636 [Pitangus sulphuratus]|nr:hypothetical protein BTVI_80636 [Pitangus sulphuratus]
MEEYEHAPLVLSDNTDGDIWDGCGVMRAEDFEVDYSSSGSKCLRLCETTQELVDNVPPTSASLLILRVVLGVPWLGIQPSPAGSQSWVQLVAPQRDVAVESNIAGAE